METFIAATHWNEYFSILSFYNLIMVRPYRSSEDLNSLNLQSAILTLQYSIRYPEFTQLLISIVIKFKQHCEKNFHKVFEIAVLPQNTKQWLLPKYHAFQYIKVNSILIVNHAHNFVLPNVRILGIHIVVNHLRFILFLYYLFLIFSNQLYCYFLHFSFYIYRCESCWNIMYKKNRPNPS